MIAGALPLPYLETVRDTLAHVHINERLTRERLGSALIAGHTFGLPIDFQPGLTDTECARIEGACGFTFPPDLRSWLQYVVPIRGDDFPNWRDNPAQQVDDDRVWLLKGIWNDIDPHQTPYFALNATLEWELVTPEFKPRMWSLEWSANPRDRDAAYAALHERFVNAPQLIRIFAHRFMPALPAESGNPVYSIVQSDIIYYGYDLTDYFAKEFRVPRPAWAADAPKEISFWSDLIRLNDG